METIHFSSEPSKMLITSIHYDRTIEAFVVQAQDIDTPSSLFYTVIDIPFEEKGVANKNLIEEIKALGNALPELWDRYSIEVHDSMLTRDLLPVFGYMVEWWATRDHDHAVIVDGYRCPGHYLWSLTPGQSVTIASRPDVDVIPSSVRSNLERRVMCQTFNASSHDSIVSDV